jgi:hypothetical protein
MPVKIAPKNDQAVVAALKNTISAKEAKKIVKTVAGRNGEVNTRTELTQLKAIRTKYATAFTTEARKLLDSEIANAAKTIAKEPRAPQRPIWGGGGGGSSGS